MNAKFKKIFIVLMSLILMSGCVKSAKSDTPSFVPPTVVPPTQTPWIVEKEVKVEVTKLVEVPKSVEVVVTATPEPKPTEAPITWTQIQVAKYVPVEKPVIINGVLWELPLGTWSAVTTKHGFYEAVKSAPVGIVNGKDNGWCGPKQLDCPPHALLVLVEVPTDKISCFKAEMDISWRINFTNTCGAPVPVKFSIRYNDVTRNASELKADYLALAGLKQQPLDTKSEVGLFVSVRESGLNELTYEGKKVVFGYSCWSCLPDTKGPNNPIPYPLVDIETFGKEGLGPTGSTLLPGVVFPLPRPEATPFTLSFEIKVIDASVIWVGRYDVLPLPLPTPTATP